MEADAAAVRYKHQTELIATLRHVHVRGRPGSIIWTKSEHRDASKVIQSATVAMCLGDTVENICFNGFEYVTCKNTSTTQFLKSYRLETVIK